MLVLNALERLVFVDESGFCTHMHRRCGKTKRGQRAVVKKRRRSKRYTVIGAISEGSLFAKRVWNRGMSQEDFEGWVQEELVPSLKSGDMVIWDNLNLHYSLRARKAIHDAGALVFFQSRYSPDFNPIEKAWSKLKAIVRRHRLTGAREMKRALDHAWRAITPKDIQGYFHHCLVKNVENPMW
jgi:transposase